MRRNLLALGFGAFLVTASPARADDAADVATYQVLSSRAWADLDKKDYEAAGKRFALARKKLDAPAVASRVERTAARDCEFGLGVALARTGKNADALAALERSAELGWHEPKPLENEPAFKGVKALPGWQKLAERVHFNEKAYDEFFKRLEQLVKDATTSLNKNDAPGALKLLVEALRRIKATKFAVSAEFEGICEYDRACALALTGRKGPALEAFVRSLDLGFCEWDQIAKDPGLAAIRDDAAFQKAYDEALKRETEALFALVAVAHDFSRKGEKEGELQAWHRVFRQIDRRRSHRGLDSVDIADWWFDYASALAANEKKEDALKALSLAIASGMKDRKKVDESAAWKPYAGDAGLEAVLAPITPKPEPKVEPKVDKTPEQPTESTPEKKPEEKPPEKKPDEKPAEKPPEKKPEPASLEAIEVKEALAKDPLFPLDLDTSDMNGGPLKLADMKGKVVLLVYWHTTPPPAVARLLDAWRDKGLAVVGLIPVAPGNTSAAEQIFSEAATSQRVDYPNAALEMDKPAAKPLGGDDSKPLLVFCDRDGKPRLQKGPNESFEQLDALVKALVEATAPEGEKK